MKKPLPHSSLSKSERESRRNKIKAFVILLVVCVVWLFPFVYVFGMSLRTTEDLVLYPNSIFPHSSGWTFDHYVDFFRLHDGGKVDTLMSALINSTITTVIHVIVSMLITVFAAYSFVFMRYKGRAFIYALIIFVMPIPSVIGFAPLYSMYISIGKQSGILDNLWYFYSWIIFPGVAGAFNLMIMYNCFRSMPKSIVESARSDGAGELEIFRRVVLPLAKSSILVCALFSFNGCWNNLVFPQLVVAAQSDVQMHSTITVALMGWIKNESVEFHGQAMASCVMSILPLMLMYFFTQSKMIDGLSSTGVKG